jgi:undecaprenyl-diphosphatase
MGRCNPGKGTRILDAVKCKPQQIGPPRLLEPALTLMLLAGVALFALGVKPAQASGGPLGIDHEWSYDDRGLWATRYQQGLEYGVMIFEAGGAFWIGDDEGGFGHTLWQSVDASVVSGISAEVLKYAFSRARPNQGLGPDKWFQGSCCDSFPSGQVTLQASFVTPLILRYERSAPWVWALEILPIYDGLARLKHQEHWQSDTLAGWALGSAAGYWAANLETPLMVQILPRGLTIGFARHF